MAVRLACPTCGTRLSPKPADAGRILPCAGCGSDIQIPKALPAAAKPVPKPLDLDEEAEEERTPKAVGGSLLWLWVLLGAGFLGFGIGACVVLLAREKHPDTPTVVEKPPAPPAPPRGEGETPKPPTPKSDLPKTDPPKKEQPKADPPKVPALTAAQTVPGLKFYLPCDALENGSVKEAVSGKLVGKGRKLAIVDGPRGKALRVTAGGPGGVREGFDLSASAEMLAVEEGKPFTLAVWVRTDERDSINSMFLDAHESNPNRFRVLSLYRYTRGVGFYMQQGKPGGGPDPQNQAAHGTREMPPTNGWIHLALTRDEKGVVRFSVDGEEAVVAPAPYTAAVQFTALSLCWQQGGSLTADFAEFCLFDRVLTAEEIARLARREK